LIVVDVLGDRKLEVRQVDFPSLDVGGESLVVLDGIEGMFDGSCAT
jgi:hypothetical protein